MLTAEDDPIVRADLRLILEEAGYDVCPDAKDGAEAVEMARAHRPDLIVMDLSLPRFDGVEATRRILRERRVPIVALTGHRSDGFVERAIEAGAVAHVLKPFHQANLVGTIASALVEHPACDETRAWGLGYDDDEFNQRALVESMVRRNYSEREITAALNGGSAWAYDIAAARSFFSRLAAFFKR